MSVEHLLEQLQTLEKHQLKEDRIRKNEELSKKKEIAAAKKKLGREISQTRIQLRRRNLEVGKLRQTLSKIERQQSDSTHKKSVLGMKLDDARQKFEEKHNCVELELQEKIGAVSEATGLLSYLEYAQGMLEQGVILEPDATSMHTRQEPLMPEGELADLSLSSVDASPLAAELKLMRSRYQEAEQEWASQREQLQHQLEELDEQYKDAKHFKNEIEALQRENSILRQENQKLSDENASLKQNLKTTKETLPSETMLNHVGPPLKTYPSSKLLIGHCLPTAAQASKISAPMPVWSVAGQQLHPHLRPSSPANQASPQACLSPRSANIRVRSRSPSLGNVLVPHGALPATQAAPRSGMGLRSVSAPIGALRSSVKQDTMSGAVPNGGSCLSPRGASASSMDAGAPPPAGAVPPGMWAFSVPVATVSLHSATVGPIHAANQVPTVKGYPLRPGSFGRAPHVPSRAATPRAGIIAPSLPAGGAANLQEEQIGSRSIQAYDPASLTSSSQRTPWRTATPQGSSPASAAHCAMTSANGSESSASEAKAELRNEVLDKSPCIGCFPGTDTVQTPVGLISTAASPDDPPSSNAFPESAGKLVGLARTLSFTQTGGTASSDASASPVVTQVERRVNFKDVVSKVTAQALREFHQNHGE